jgi:hypothetical protein
MRRIHLERWATHIQAPRNPRTPCHNAARIAQRNISARGYQVQQQQWAQRRAYTVSARRAAEVEQVQEADAIELETPTGPAMRYADPINPKSERRARAYNDDLNAPSHSRALRSGKLAALHSRLSLPSKLPLQTLARCLIDSSVDSRPGYNNAPLALLGQDLLGYYTSNISALPQIKYLRVPDEIVDIVKEQQATAQAQRGGGHRGGRGGDRGDRGRGRGQGGRGRGRGGRGQA